MSDITITKNEVRMVIEYVETFENEAEMIEAIKGASELRGLVAKPDPNDDETTGEV